MPVMKCTCKSGKPGYKWGKNGKCYRSRAKAVAQGRATKANKGEK